MTRPSDSFEKQTDPTTKEPHSSLTVNDSMTHVDYIQETENNEMLEEVTQTVPQVKKTDISSVQKWDDLINADVDVEQDHEKHGTKRVKSKMKMSGIQDEKESEDSTMETVKYPQTQMTSPKRLKKIKVHRDLIPARERTRSQSRQKPPNQC